MFKRRHPYLFFILSFVAIISGTSIITSTFFAVGDKFSVAGTGDVVGVIEIEGVIIDSQKTIKDIKRFRDNDLVKAIVLRINSPGGAVGPSQEIYREVIKTKDIKKVIVSMGSIAASGGYYAAAPADGIMANPGTITGSIGVIMGYTNVRELFNKIGLVPVVIKSGKYKDLGSPVKTLTENDRKMLQGFADNIHNRFIKDVAFGRNMDVAVMEKLADGRIYTGEEAQELKLIDRLGNFEDAVEWAGRLGGIKGIIETIYPPDEKLTIMEFLTMSALSKTVSEVRNLMTPTVTAKSIYNPSM